jgi:hypothetical protein
MGWGSGIRKKTVPYPVSRGQKGTGFRIRFRKTGCYKKNHATREDIVMSAKNLVYLRGQLEFGEEENVAAGAAAGLLGAHQRFQVKGANMPEK